MWRKASAMRACLLLAAAARCAHVRDVDFAGFLLMGCVHSPGTTRVLLANKIIVPFQTPKTKPNPQKFVKICALSSDFLFCFGKLTIFGDRVKSRN